ncbi:MAG: hypothetical protein KGL39_16940 [Patescibacteria group bacterium]|nr:hypothetical protein [Patescibacteria group bacterium]
MRVRPDGKYLIFVDVRSVDMAALDMSLVNTEADVQILLVAPPQGKSLRDCVAVLDQSVPVVIDPSSVADEAIVQVAKRQPVITVPGDGKLFHFQNIGGLIKAAVAAERERCARIAESEASQYNHPTLKHCETAVSSYRVAMYIADEIRGRE